MSPEKSHSDISPREVQGKPLAAVTYILSDGTWPSTPELTGSPDLKPTQISVSEILFSNMASHWRFSLLPDSIILSPAGPRNGGVRWLSLQDLCIGEPRTGWAITYPQIRRGNPNIQLRRSCLDLSWPLPDYKWRGCWVCPGNRCREYWDCLRETPGTQRGTAGSRACFKNHGVYKNHLGIAGTCISRLQSPGFCLLINTLGLPRAHESPKPKKEF